MKITDYCPRAAPIDKYLIGRELVGVEVGVDVGAHAEALLTYCPVAMLHLVDPWPNIERRGYCDGRLSRFRGRYALCRMGSLTAASETRAESVDFVYLDQEHGAEVVAADLEAWWPAIKPGGVLGHRNYVQSRGEPLDKAIEAFVDKHAIETKYERYGSDIILFKP
jgi:hypothetical protein